MEQRQSNFLVAWLVASSERSHMLQEKHFSPVLSSDRSRTPECSLRTSARRSVLMPRDPQSRIEEHQRRREGSSFRRSFSPEDCQFQSALLECERSSIRDSGLLLSFSWRIKQGRGSETGACSRDHRRFPEECPKQVGRRGGRMLRACSPCGRLAFAVCEKYKAKRKLLIKL